MWQWVARGNIQQTCYIPQAEQHSPFRLMLLRLGNASIIYFLLVCTCSDGEIPQATMLVLINSALFVLFTTLSCLGILFAFACLIFNLVFRKKQ